MLDHVGGFAQLAIGRHRKDRGTAATVVRDENILSRSIQR
jgi:hypothetical protein